MSVVKTELEKRTATLEVAKTALESREKMFSFGILAALTTALIAVVGLIGKLPALRIERKLKELEVEERLLKLAVMRKNAVADA